MSILTMNDERRKTKDIRRIIYRVQDQDRRSTKDVQRSTKVNTLVRTSPLISHRIRQIALRQVAPIIRRLRSIVFTILLAFPILLLLGCETAVDPFDETGRYFSFYGYLDAELDTQFVRVVALRDTITAPAGPIDAEVIVTDLNTNETTVWQDSVFNFSDFREQTGHVFWTVRRPEIGHSYEFTVRRSDEAASSATVTVPYPPADPVIEIPPRIGLYIKRRIVWPEAFPAAEVLMVYHVKDTASFFVTKEVIIPYTESFVMNEETSEVIIDLTSDYNDIYNAFGFPRGTVSERIELLGLEIHVAKASDAWTFVASHLSYETLAFPGRFSNVEFGLGFLGAVVRSSYFWTVTPEEVAMLGYRDGLER